MRDLGECGYGTAHSGVEISIRPAPVCTEEPIGTIVRNRERTDIDWPHRAAKLFERGQDLPIDLPDVGKVVLDQPETCGRRIIGDDHEAMPGHPCELCKATHAVRPVVDREDGQRGGKGGIAELEVRRGGLYDGYGTG